MDLAALPVDATKEEVADLFTQTKYSRLLIYREDIDHIIGTIHQKDFYVGCGVTDKPLEEILSPVMFVLENEPISLLLKNCSWPRPRWPWWWTSTAAPAAS